MDAPWVSGRWLTHLGGIGKRNRAETFEGSARDEWLISRSAWVGTAWGHSPNFLEEGAELTAVHSHRYSASRLVVGQLSQGRYNTEHR